MEIFHFLPTRQVNSQAYDITANTPIKPIKGDKTTCPEKCNQTKPKMYAIHISG
jgi:hypothetical protein